MALLEMGGDGGGTGFVACAIEVLAQGHDLLLDGLWGAARARLWSAWSGCQAGFALDQALDVGDHPAAGHAVGAGDFAFGAALDQYRGDHQLAIPIVLPLSSGVNDVPRQV